MEFEHPVYFDKEEAKNWGDYYYKSAQTGSGFRHMYGAGIPGGFNANLRQRGFGLPGGYHGDQRMNGGIWPALGFLTKLLPIVGSVAVNSFAEPVKNLATDIFSGKDPLESASRAAHDSIKRVGQNIIGQITGQNGNGTHKRRKVAKKSKPKKTKKTETKKLKKNNKRSGRKRKLFY